MKLTLFRLDFLFSNRFTEELARVQELFEQETGDFAKYFDSFGVNICQIVRSWFARFLRLLIFFLFCSFFF